MDRLFSLHFLHLFVHVYRGCSLFSHSALAHFGLCGRPLATNPPVWGREERGESSGPAPPAPAAHLTSPPRHHTVCGPAIHWPPVSRAPDPGSLSLCVHTLATLTPGCGRAEVSGGRAGHWPHQHPGHSHRPRHLYGDFCSTGTQLKCNGRAPARAASPRHIHEHKVGKCWTSARNTNDYNHH